jgi:hypothetical protein
VINTWREVPFAKELPILTIELTGCGTATCDGISVTRARPSPIPLLCRKLIARGHAPTELVSVVRGGAASFLPRSLQDWGEYDIIDDDKRGFIRRKWKPFAGIGETNGDTPSNEGSLEAHTV